MRPVLLGLVFCGGAVGTLARWKVGTVLSHPWRLPLGTFAVNVLGAFVLGLLLEELARPDRSGRADGGRRRGLRLAVGTGFCGGFTTYSALATDTSLLIQQGRPGPALGYALGTLVLGLLAAAGGIAWASRRRRSTG